MAASLTPFPPIAELAASVRSRERTAVSVVDDCLARIEAVNPRLNCFREWYPDEARAAAAAIDRRITAGENPGLLAGVPLAVKDNIATSFGRTSAGSRMLEEYRSPYTATAVQRLLDAGAVIVGKTNCDEFAMGSSTEHCAFGAVRNPWDPGCVPGGSSGGSAAAVAAGLCAAALGSDTGGSIRQPAALCGVVGAKPSYGRVSRYGLVAFGSSLDQIGPITGSVADAALLMRVIAGADPRDSTCADVAVPDYTNQLDRPIADLRIGVPREYRGGENDPAVDRALDEAIEHLAAAGAEIIEVELPLTAYGVSTYYVIAPAEASSNLARYDGIRYGRRAEPRPGESLDELYARSRAEGFGPEVQRRIMLGTWVLSAGYHDAYYERALRVRRRIRDEYEHALSRCHALLGPTSPMPAFELGAREDPLSMYLCDVYTANTALAGICAIALPAGLAEANGRRLPVGVQLQCRAFDEMTMFRIGALYERQRGVARELPPLAAEVRS